MDEIKKIRNLISRNLATIKEKFGVEEIGIFGSYARNQQTEESDLDVVVVFENGRNDLFNYSRLKSYLENLTGKEVDLVIKEGIKPDLRDRILGEVQYA